MVMAVSTGMTMEIGMRMSTSAASSQHACGHEHDYGHGHDQRAAAVAGVTPSALKVRAHRGYEALRRAENDLQSKHNAELSATVDDLRAERDGLRQAHALPAHRIQPGTQPSTLDKYQRMPERDSCA